MKIESTTGSDARSVHSEQTIYHDVRGDKTYRYVFKATVAGRTFTFKRTLEPDHEIDNPAVRSRIWADLFAEAFDGHGPVLQHLGINVHCGPGGPFIPRDD